MALALMMKSCSDGVVKHIGEDCERPEETTRSAISFRYTCVKKEYPNYLDIIKNLMDLSTIREKAKKMESCGK